MKRRIKYKKRKKPLPNQRLSRQLQYEDVRWKEFSHKIFVRDNFKCTEPGCDGTCKELHAHHLRYAMNKYIWEVPESWVKTKCAKCHSKIHHRNLYKTRKKKPQSTKTEA